MASLNAIFDINARWDRSEKKLQIPAQYGRLREVQAPQIYRLIIDGYIPEPLRLELEEMSAYYQNPVPNYFATNDEPYESIRDFLTNKPIQTHGDAEDHANGYVIASAKGTVLGAPMETRGNYEKLAGTSRLVNGSFRWGFPKFQLRAGREYSSVGRFNNQYEVLDHVTVSHSNNRYGDEDHVWEYNTEGFYGEDDFSVFISTTLFSQVADFQQSVGGAEIDLTRHFESQRTLGITARQYYFKNTVKQISSELHDQSFFDDIFGDGTVTVDPADQKALLQSVVTDRHQTSVVEAAYRDPNLFQLYTQLGVSSFKTEDNLGMTVRGYDRLYGARLGGRASRLDMSYETVDPNFKSIGNPLLYQDRNITRFTPYFDLSRVWKIYGDYRREDSKILVRQGLDPWTNVYWTGSTLLNLRRTATRLSYTEFDSTLYGDRTTTDLNHTRYFGRHSADVGGAYTEQSLNTGLLYRQSYTGRLSFQLLWPKRRISVGEDYTYHHYSLFQTNRRESLTSLRYDEGRFQSLLQYDRKPRSSLELVNLHTANLRVGRDLSARKTLYAFFSISSLHANLEKPDVWRGGFEYRSRY